MSGVVIDIAAESRSAEEQLKEINRHLANIVRNTDLSSKALGGFNASGLKNISKQTRETSKGFVNLHSSAKTSLSGMDSSIKKSGSSMGSLKGILLSLVASFAAFKGVSVFNKTADDLTKVQNKLSLVEKNFDSLLVTQERLYKISKVTASSLGDTAALYTSFTKALESQGTSKRVILGVTKTIQQAAAMSGSSVEGVKAAILQLNQGISSGTLRGEELNSVLEQLPYLGFELQKSLNMNAGALRKFAEEGKLTSAVVLDSIKGMAESTDKEFKNTAFTVEMSFNKLLNTISYSIGNINKAIGSSTGLSKRLNLFSEYIDQFSVDTATAYFTLTRMIENFKKRLDNFTTMELVVDAAFALKITSFEKAFDYYDFYKEAAGLKAVAEKYAEDVKNKGLLQANLDFEMVGKIIDNKADIKAYKERNKLETDARNKAASEKLNGFSFFGKDVKSVENSSTVVDTFAKSSVVLYESLKAIYLVSKDLGYVLRAYAVPPFMMMDRAMLASAAIARKYAVTIADSYYSTQNSLRSMMEAVNPFLLGQNIERSFVNIFRSDGLESLTDNIRSFNKELQKGPTNNYLEELSTVFRPTSGLMLGIYNAGRALGIFEYNLYSSATISNTKVVRGLGIIGRSFEMLYTQILVPRFGPALLMAFLQFKAFFKQVTRLITGSFNEKYGIIFANALIKAVKTAFVFVKNSISNLYDVTLRTLSNKSGDSISAGVVNIFLSLFGFLKGFLVTILAEIYNQMSNLFYSLASSFSKISKNVFNSLKTGLLDFKNIMGDQITFDIGFDFSGKFEKITDFVSELYNANLKPILSKFKAFTEGIIDYFRVLYDKVIGNSYWTDLIEYIQDSSGKLNAAAANIGSFINKVLSSFGNMYRGSKSSLSGFFSNLDAEFKKYFEDLSASTKKNLYIAISSAFIYAFGGDKIRGFIKGGLLVLSTQLFNTIFPELGKALTQEVGIALGNTITFFVEVLREKINLFIADLPLLINSALAGVGPIGTAVDYLIPDNTVLYAALAGALAYMTMAEKGFAKVSKMILGDFKILPDGTKKFKADGLLQYFQDFLSKLTTLAFGMQPRVAGALSGMFNNKLLLASVGVMLASLLDSISIYESLIVAIPLAIYGLLGKEAGNRVYVNILKKAFLSPIKLLLLFLEASLTALWPNYNPLLKVFDVARWLRSALTRQRNPVRATILQFGSELKELFTNLLKNKDLYGKGTITLKAAVLDNGNTAAPITAGYVNNLRSLRASAGNTFDKIRNASLAFLTNFRNASQRAFTDLSKRLVAYKTVFLDFLSTAFGKFALITSLLLALSISFGDAQAASDRFSASSNSNLSIFVDSLGAILVSIGAVGIALGGLYKLLKKPVKIGLDTKVWSGSLDYFFGNKSNIDAKALKLPTYDIADSSNSAFAGIPGVGNNKDYRTKQRKTFSAFGSLDSKAQNKYFGDIIKENKKVTDAMRGGAVGVKSVWTSLFSFLFKGYRSIFTIGVGLLSVNALTNGVSDSVGGFGDTLSKVTASVAIFAAQLMALALAYKLLKVYTKGRKDYIAEIASKYTSKDIPGVDRNPFEATIPTLKDRAKDKKGFGATFAGLRAVKNQFSDISSLFPSMTEAISAPFTKSAAAASKSWGKGSYIWGSIKGLTVLFWNLAKMPLILAANILMLIPIVDILLAAVMIPFSGLKAGVRGLISNLKTIDFKAQGLTKSFKAVGTAIKLAWVALAFGAKIAAVVVGAAAIGGGLFALLLYGTQGEVGFKTTFNYWFDRIKLLMGFQASSDMGRRFDLSKSVRSREIGSNQFDVNRDLTTVDLGKMASSQYSLLKKATEELGETINRLDEEAFKNNGKLDATQQKEYDTSVAEYKRLLARMPQNEGGIGSYQKQISQTLLDVDNSFATRLMRLMGLGPITDPTQMPAFRKFLDNVSVGLANTKDNIKAFSERLTGSTEAIGKFFYWISIVLPLWDGLAWGIGEVIGGLKTFAAWLGKKWDDATRESPTRENILRESYFSSRLGILNQDKGLLTDTENSTIETLLSKVSANQIELRDIQRNGLTMSEKRQTDGLERFSKRLLANREKQRILDIKLSELVVKLQYNVNLRKIANAITAELTDAAKEVKGAFNIDVGTAFEGSNFNELEAKRITLLARAFTFLGSKVKDAQSIREKFYLYAKQDNLDKTANILKEVSDKFSTLRGEAESVSEVFGLLGTNLVFTMRASDRNGFDSITKNVKDYIVAKRQLEEYRSGSDNYGPEQENTILVDLRAARDNAFKKLRAAPTPDLLSINEALKSLEIKPFDLNMNVPREVLEELYQILISMQEAKDIGNSINEDHATRVKSLREETNLSERLKVTVAQISLSKALDVNTSITDKLKYFSDIFNEDIPNGIMKSTNLLNSWLNANLQLSAIATELKAAYNAKDLPQIRLLSEQKDKLELNKTLIENKSKPQAFIDVIGELNLDIPKENLVSLSEEIKNKVVEAVTLLNAGVLTYEQEVEVRANLSNIVISNLSDFSIKSKEALESAFSNVGLDSSKLSNYTKTNIKAAEKLNEAYAKANIAKDFALKSGNISGVYAAQKLLDNIKKKGESLQKTLADVKNKITEILGIELDSESFFKLSKNVRKSLESASKYFEDGLTKLEEGSALVGGKSAEAFFEEFAAYKNTAKIFSFMSKLATQSRDILKGGIKNAYDQINKILPNLDIKNFLDIPSDISRDIANKLSSNEILKDFLLEVNLNEDQLSQFQRLVNTGMSGESILKAMKMSFPELKSESEKTAEALADASNEMIAALFNDANATKSLEEQIRKLTEVQFIQKAPDGKEYTPRDAKTFNSRIDEITARPPRPSSEYGDAYIKQQAAVVMKERMPEISMVAELARAKTSFDLKNARYGGSNVYSGKNYVDPGEAFAVVSEKLKESIGGVIPPEALDKFFEYINKGDSNNVALYRAIADSIGVTSNEYDREFLRTLGAILTEQQGFSKELQNSKDKGADLSNLKNYISPKEDAIEFTKSLENALAKVNLKKEVFTANKLELPNKNMSYDEVVKMAASEAQKSSKISEVVKPIFDTLAPLFGDAKDLRELFESKLIDKASSNGEKGISPQDIAEILGSLKDFEPYAKEFNKFVSVASEDAKRAAELQRTQNENLSKIGATSSKHSDFLKGIDESVTKLQPLNVTITGLQTSLESSNASIITELSGIKTALTYQFIPQNASPETMGPPAPSEVMESPASPDFMGPPAPTTVSTGLPNNLTQYSVLTTPIASLDFNITELNRTIKEFLSRSSSRYAVNSTEQTLGFASGGKISGKGGPTSDSILARLSNGEFVVNAKATANNRAILEAINSGYKLPGFAKGGITNNEYNKYITKNGLEDQLNQYKELFPKLNPTFWEEQFIGKFDLTRLTNGDKIIELRDQMRDSFRGVSLNELPKNGLDNVQKVLQRYYSDVISLQNGNLGFSWNDYFRNASADMYDKEVSVPFLSAGSNPEANAAMLSHEVGHVSHSLASGYPLEKEIKKAKVPSKSFKDTVFPYHKSKRLQVIAETIASNIASELNPFDTSITPFLTEALGGYKGNILSNTVFKAITDSKLPVDFSKTQKYKFLATEVLSNNLLENYNVLGFNRSVPTKEQAALFEKANSLTEYTTNLEDMLSPDITDRDALLLANKRKIEALEKIKDTLPPEEYFASKEKLAQKRIDIDFKYSSIKGLEDELSVGKASLNEVLGKIAEYKPKNPLGHEVFTLVKNFWDNKQFQAASVGGLLTGELLDSLFENIIGTSNPLRKVITDFVSSDSFSNSEIIKQLLPSTKDFIDTPEQQRNNDELMSILNPGYVAKNTIIPEKDKPDLSRILPSVDMLGSIADEFLKGIIMAPAGGYIGKAFKLIPQNIQKLILAEMYAVLGMSYSDTAPDINILASDFMPFINDLNPLKKFATGGKINGPGSGTSDSILARLSNGEFVVNAKATANNRAILEAINRGYKLPGFASGSQAEIDVRRQKVEAGVATIVLDLQLPSNFNDLIMRMLTLENHTFDPSLKNPDSTASGIWQINEKTANALGYTAEKIREMSIEQQMVLGKELLILQAKTGGGKPSQMKTPGDLYTALFAPAHTFAPPETVLYPKGSPGYNANPRYASMSANPEVGITKADLEKIMNGAVYRNASASGQSPTPQAPITPQQQAINDEQRRLSYASLEINSIDQILRAISNFSIDKQVAYKLDELRISIDEDLFGTLSNADYAVFDELTDKVYETRKALLGVSKTLDPARFKEVEKSAKDAMKAAKKFADSMNYIAQKGKAFNDSIFDTMQGGLSTLITDKDADPSEIIPNMLDNISKGIVDQFLESIFKPIKDADPLKETGSGISKLGMNIGDMIVGLFTGKSPIAPIAPPTTVAPIVPPAIIATESLEALRTAIISDPANSGKLLAEAATKMGQTPQQVAAAMANATSQSTAGLCACMASTKDAVAGAAADAAKAPGNNKDVAGAVSTIQNGMSSYDSFMGESASGIKDATEAATKAATEGAADAAISTNEKYWTDISGQAVKFGQGLTKIFSGDFTGIIDIVSSTINIVKDIIKLIAMFSDGGYVSGKGTGTSDSIPAMLSNGEFVVNAKATKDNYKLLTAINTDSIGKLMPKFGTGGKIYGSGTGTSDSIPAMLSNGEFVINAKATKEHYRLLTAINTGSVKSSIPKFASGGLVSGPMAVPSNINPNDNKSTINNSESQIVNINITGDISRQTKAEIYKMLPEITSGVNYTNKSRGYRG